MRALKFFLEHSKQKKVGNSESHSPFLCSSSILSASLFASSRLHTGYGSWSVRDFLGKSELFQQKYVLKYWDDVEKADQALKGKLDINILIIY